MLVHLSMITIGILIALGLEQAVEAWHHHELGVEAQENILTEIRDNKREIDGDRALVKQDKEKLQRTLDTVRQFLAHKKLSHSEMNIGINAANLDSTSWTTAAATGAIAYMGYASAKKFAKAYDLQGLVQRTQDEEFRAVASAWTLVSFSPTGPDKLNDEQLRSLESELLTCLGKVTIWEQLASQLSDEYARVLKAQ